MTKTQEKLLLYWSGELGPEDTAEIEALLAHDVAAQNYLRELDGLGEELKGIPSPQPAPDLIAGVLAETPTFQERLVPIRPVRRSFFFKVTAAAAAILLAGLFAFFSNQPPHPESTTAQAPPTPATRDAPLPEKDPRTAEATPLSKRLFNSRPAFASALKDRHERREDRRRYGKLSNS